MKNENLSFPPLLRLDWAAESLLTSIFFSFVSCRLRNDHSRESMMS